MSGAQTGSNPEAAKLVWVYETTPGDFIVDSDGVVWEVLNSAIALPDLKPHTLVLRAYTYLPDTPQAVRNKTPPGSLHQDDFLRRFVYLGSKEAADRALQKLI